MYWIVLGVIVGLGLLVLPFPHNVAVAVGLILGTLWYMASLLEQLLARLAGATFRAEIDPDQPLQRLARARVDRSRRYRLKRRE